MIDLTPQLQATQSLLAQVNLPGDDLTEADMQRFLYAGAAHEPDAVIGLECYAPVGLLRSLAVREAARGQGLAASLVYTLEDLANSLSVTHLYLLTLDADPFFERLGYRTAPRKSAPAEIKATTQYSVLCPEQAILMFKRL